MSESLLRSFFTLFYERLGILILWSALRSLPWLILALILTFLPPGSLPLNYLMLLGAVGLTALLIAPLLAGGVYCFCAGLAREKPVSWTEGMGRRYLAVLIWDLLQALLAALLLWNLGTYMGLSPEQRSFAMLLALGTGFWLWFLARLWSFRFLPLLIARDTSIGNTVRTTLLFIFAQPGRTLAHFGQRQLLGLILLLSGLGLFFGLGGLLPLHACLSTRLILKEQGQDLAPPGAAQPDAPLPEGKDLKQIWRPWD